MNTQPHYDVFLAHNSQDKLQVKIIATKLKERRLRVWLDEEQIPAGQPFQDVIQQAIQNVRSAAIFIGPGGLGKWQRLELRSLITKFVDADIPVIPVLLPGVDGIPENLYFLQDLNWVNFASGIDDEQALNQLVSGINQQLPIVSSPHPRHFDRHSRLDVLLFYNDQDDQQVQPIMDYLRQQQIQFWVPQKVGAGDSWQQQLETQVAQINSVAIFIGTNGNLWKREQIEPFIWEFIERGRPVIPVILPNVPQEPELPIYLRRRTRVDFRQPDQQDPNPMEQLSRGITGNRSMSSPPINSTSPPPVSSPEVKVIRQLDNQSLEENNSRSRNALLGILVILGITGIIIGIYLYINNYRSLDFVNNKYITKVEGEKICKEEGKNTLEELKLEPSQYKEEILEYDDNIVADYKAWKYVCTYKKIAVKNQKLVIIKVGLDLDVYCVNFSGNTQMKAIPVNFNSKDFLFKCTPSPSATALKFLNDQEL